VSQIFRSRVWCVGDDINTDLILPNDMLNFSRPERAQSVFRANRPGWAAQVRQGDILIGGRNFGMGSGRPSALAMKDLGLVCVLADSLNALFFRNCVNEALAALEIAGVRAAFEEGDEAEVDFEAAVVTNLRTGQRLAGAPWPEMLLKSMRAGGLIERLEAEGLIHPAGWNPPPEASAT
jgi:3-isopropylmalate/(R)-2-methylmalate dehydratase small subunit